MSDKLVLVFAPTQRDFRLWVAANGDPRLPIPANYRCISSEAQIVGLHPDEIEDVYVTAGGGGAYRSPTARVLFNQASAMGIPWGTRNLTPSTAGEVATIVFAKDAKSYNEWLRAEPRGEEGLYMFAGTAASVLNIVNPARFDAAVVLDDGGPTWDTYERRDFFIRAKRLGKRWATDIWGLDEAAELLQRLERELRHPLNEPDQGSTDDDPNRDP